MTLDEWKKNDLLMKRALEKMDLQFKRNRRTWEANVYFKSPKRYVVECWDINENVVFQGPNDPESFGEINMFVIYDMKTGVCNYICNRFHGVKSYEELSIFLDLNFIN